MVLNITAVIFTLTEGALDLSRNCGSLGSDFNPGIPIKRHIHQSFISSPCKMVHFSSFISQVSFSIFISDSQFGLIASAGPAHRQVFAINYRAA